MVDEQVLERCLNHEVATIKSGVDQVPHIKYSHCYHKQFVVVNQLTHKRKNNITLMWYFELKDNIPCTKVPHNLVHVDGRVPIVDGIHDPIDRDERSRASGSYKGSECCGRKD